jgi:hypothetical protein
MRPHYKIYSEMLSHWSDLEIKLDPYFTKCYAVAEYVTEGL